MVKIKDIAIILNGDRSSNYPSGKDFKSYGIPFINAGHLSKGTIDYSQMDYISKEKYACLSGAKIRSNDILLCLRGTLGKYALVTVDGGAPASSLAVIRPKQEVINVNYLICIIASPIFQNQILEQNNGSSQPNLSASSVSEFQIPLPPMEEQRKIAEVLSDMDGMIASLEKLIAKKKDIKQGAMQELLTGRKRLPGFHKPFKEYPYKNICQFVNGRAYAQNELLSEGKYKVLRLGNLFTNEHWYYTDLELPEKQYCDNGDLIYAWSATFGPRIWKGDKVVYHYHIWKVLCNEYADKDFLFHYFMYDTKSMEKELQGGTMSHLTKDTMEKRRCILPCIEEQKSIAAILTDMDTEIKKLEEKLAKCRQTKQGMMQQLLTGRIRLI